jgi:hypothetical protein
MTSAAPFANPDLPATVSFTANAELELLNTTKIPPNMALQPHGQAEFTYRKGSSRWRHALVTVFPLDQAMTLFSYDLSGQVTNPTSGDWKVNVAAGTSVPSAVAGRFAVPMFGDDTKITLKAGATPPTDLRISIELSESQVADV